MVKKIQTYVRTVKDLAGDNRFCDFMDPHRLLDFPSWKLKTYQTNPFLANLETPCQLIGVKEGVVVGRRNSFPARIVANGKVYNTRISGSVFVDPKSRSGLYAVSLLQQALQFPNGDLNINCGLTVQNQKFYRLMGSAMFPIFKFDAGGRWNKYYKGGPFYGVKLCLAKVLNCVVSILNCLDRARWKNLPQWSVRQINHQDDVFLEQACALIKGDGHLYRQEITPGWIRWTIENDFITEKREKKLFGVYDGDVLVGFGLTRKDCVSNICKIYEWQLRKEYQNQEFEFLALLSKEILSFGARVYIGVGGDSEATLKKLSSRFVNAGVNYAVVTIADGSKFNEFKGIRESINWRIRPGMGDAPFW